MKTFPCLMMIMIAYLLHSQQSVVMTNHIDGKRRPNPNFAIPVDDSNSKMLSWGNDLMWSELPKISRCFKSLRKCGTTLTSSNCWLLVFSKEKSWWARRVQKQMRKPMTPIILTSVILSYEVGFYKIVVLQHNGLEKHWTSKNWAF